MKHANITRQSLYSYGFKIYSVFKLLVVDGYTRNHVTDCHKHFMFSEWQYTAGRPHYLNQPNYSWPSESSNCFSQLQPGVFHISLRTHKTQHIQPRGRKKRTNNHGLGLAPSTIREKSVTLSKHSVRQWANASVYSGEIPWKPPEMLTHLLTLANPASQSTGSSSCSLLPTAMFSSLVSSVFWLLLTLVPSFLRPFLVSWEISRASLLCGFHAKTDKGVRWLALTHTHRNECHPSCHKWTYSTN